MKKILSLLIIASTLVFSSFAIEVSIGGRGSFGGNLGNPDPKSTGLVLGGGFYANAKLFGGFGIQAEVNLVSKTLTAKQNSVTITPNYYQVIDVPIMGWYNYNITDKFEVGGGAGINLSFYTEQKVRTNPPSTVNVGGAIGGNIKYNIFRNFGLVLGLHSVFDFLPTNKIEGPNGQVTYIFGEGCERKAIFATIGAEVKLNFASNF